MWMMQYSKEPHSLPIVIGSSVFRVLTKTPNSDWLERPGAHLRCCRYQSPVGSRCTWGYRNLLFMSTPVVGGEFQLMGICIFFRSPSRPPLRG